MLRSRMRKSNTFLYTIICLSILLSVLTAGCGSVSGSGSAADSGKAVSSVVSEDTVSGAADTVSGVTFRTDELLTEHYEKHVVLQKEFGDITKEEYLALAVRLVEHPAASVLTKADSDGNKLFYDPDTNEFAVLSDDGYIRTFFKPSGGQSYYDRQE